MTEATQVIENIANVLRPEVAVIEARIPTTRGHYGTYMAIIGKYADDPQQGLVLALALKKAGANPQGVDDAFRVSF